MRRQRRTTRRKQAVIDAVRSVQSPFTIEQLFHATQRFLPGVSRATVYRTICILRDEGWIREICLPHGKRVLAHTDADVVCVVECQDCGRLTSVSPSLLSSQLLSVARQNHFSPVQTSIYVRGQCQDWRGAGGCPLRERSAPEPKGKLVALKRAPSQPVVPKATE